MIFEGKPTRDITIDELKQLIEDHVSEDRYIDFKREAYPQSGSGTREQLKDVTAFANADGGYIILGVEEDGQGRAIAFHNIEEAETARQSMIDRCLARIEPRLRELDIGIFNIDDYSVLVVRVPESDLKPHCAKPDAEHHYFWRRYEDGNKLMTTTEIRECFESDRVERGLAEIRRELSSMRQEATVAEELSLQGNDINLPQLTTTLAFLKHVEDRFLREIGSRPYYRLFACPDPPWNDLRLNNHLAALRDIAGNPPALRPHGWDLKTITDPRITEYGIEVGENQSYFSELRIFRNGYMEFRTRTDDESFHWAQTGDPKPINPQAIIEPTVCMTLLAVRVCGLVDYDGPLVFGLRLDNACGLLLLPYAPSTFGYRIAAQNIGGALGGRMYSDESVVTPNVNVFVSELPGTVPWRLVSEVYYRFGFSDEHVPFFDDQHRCTIGATQ